MGRILCAGLGGGKGQMAGGLCGRAAGKRVCWDLLQILLSHGVFNVFSGIISKMVS